ncbi:hypothetical protein ABK040_012345 [Willaertia magna]
MKKSYQQENHALSKGQNFYSSFQVKNFISKIYKNENIESQNQLITFSKKFKNFYCTCVDEKLNILNYKTNEILLNSFNLNSIIYGMDVSSDDRFLSIITKNGLLSIFSLKNCSILKQLRLGGNSPMLNLEYSPNNLFLAISFADGSLSIYRNDLNNFICLETFTKLHRTGNSHLLKWLNNNSLISCGMDGCKVISLISDNKELGKALINFKRVDENNEREQEELEDYYESVTFIQSSSLHSDRNDIREAIMLENGEFTLLITCGYASLYIHQVIYEREGWELKLLKTIPMKHYITSLLNVSSFQKDDLNNFVLIGCTPMKKKNNLMKIVIPYKKKALMKKINGEDETEDWIKNIKDSTMMGIVKMFLVNESEIFAVATDSNFLILKREKKESDDEEFHYVKKGQRLGFNDDVLDMVYFPNNSIETDNHEDEEGQIDDNKMKKGILAVATNSESIILFDINNANSNPIALSGHSDMVLSLTSVHSSSYKNANNGGKKKKKATASEDNLEEKINNYLVSGSKDKTIKVWDLKTYENIATGTGHLSSVTALCLSHPTKEKNAEDEYFLYSASDDGVVKKWNFPQMKALAMNATCHKKTISEIQISPDNQLLATACADKTCKILDCSTLQNVQFELKHKRAVWCCKFSPVEKVIATGCSDHLIRIWSLKSGQVVKVLQGHDQSVLKLNFVNFGTQLLSADANGIVRLWLIKTGECMKVFSDIHLDRIWSITMIEEKSSLEFPQQYQQLCLKRQEEEVSGKEDLKANQIVGVDGYHCKLAFITGGEDSKINIWYENTESVKEEKRKEINTNVLQDQELHNLQKLGKLKDALIKAIQLDRPKLTYEIIEKILKEKNSMSTIESVLLEVPKLDIIHLFQYCIDWNSNSKFCQISQIILNKMFDVLDPSFIDIAYEKSVDALVLYSQKHLKRMKNLQQKTNIIEYMLQQMNTLLPDQNALAVNKDVKLNVFEKVNTELEQNEKKRPLQDVEEDGTNGTTTTIPTIKVVQVVGDDELDDDDFEEDEEITTTKKEEPSLKKIKSQ